MAKRRKPCQNCGELVSSPDEHYVDAERIGCWWTCPSIAEIKERIKRLRTSIAADQKTLAYYENRRAIRREAKAASRG